MERPSDDVPVRAPCYIFDLMGTLVPVPDAGMARSRLEVCARILGVDEARFARAWRDTFAERNSGAWGTRTEDYLTRLTSFMGVQPGAAAIAAVAEERRRFARDTLKLSDENAAVLAELRSRGHRIGLITVCGTAVGDIWAELPYRELVDYALLSCTTGLVKPAVECYTQTCDQLGVNPADAWYVGDGAGDELIGAARAGLTPILLHSPTSIDAGLAPASWTGRRITSIRELVEPHRSS